MEKRKLFAAFLVGTLVLLAISAVVFADCGSCGKGGQTEKKATKPQTTCPVLGGKIDKNVYVDVEGYRIYLCCAGCADKVKADPKKYIEKIRANGEEPERCPTKAEGCKDKPKCCGPEARSCE